MVKGLIVDCYFGFYFEFRFGSDVDIEIGFTNAILLVIPFLFLITF